ncbi:MAG TPA: TadE/TadG family type IV pilus assembly protein [Pyrinomonadaceae bacterium]|nr:TadE/TadG family type IV pilus assembly protein [Pyrinomonadaceae bacterium]
MMHHRIKKIRNLRRSRRLHWLNRFRRDEQGVQLVELAIVLPIMLLLFASLGEFGRYFYEYSTAAKGARLGARYLASKSATSNAKDWEVIAKNIVVYGNAAGDGDPILPGMTTANVDVEYSGGTAGVPELVKVSIVDYQHESLFDLGALLNSPSLSLNVDVKPSVTMRYLLTTPSV